MNTSAIEDEKFPHSELLDRRWWADNPSYVIRIPPRINKYSQRADDATIQFHIDAVGKDNVGAVDGSLTVSGNMNALLYPECLPDRMAAVAYLTESVFFWDGKVTIFSENNITYR